MQPKGLILAEAKKSPIKDVSNYVLECRDQPIMLIFYLLCYAPVLKFLTYYAQYYAHVKYLCLKFDCFIRV